MQSSLAARFFGYLFLIGMASMAHASTANQETVLYSFQGGADGGGPGAGVIADRAGNLYGTTRGGGSAGGGTVYELSPPSLPGGAWTEQVLYNFQGGSDGDVPLAALVRDGAGNLYGTTSAGGGGTGCPGSCGVVFELMPPAQSGGAWTFTTLYVFQGGSDGASPMTTLIRDPNGRLYGTTPVGGIAQCAGGCGTVFELFPPSAPGGSWTEKVIYRFRSWADGYSPMAGLIFDVHGNLYGTTMLGGRIGGNIRCKGGCGTAFELVRPQPGRAWTKTEIYVFGGSDGVHPSGSLVFDEAGNLYGTTQQGGVKDCDDRFGCGNVYELSPPSQQRGPWTTTSLYAFGGHESRDGNMPVAGVIRDGLGNIYGTTPDGTPWAAGGIVFKLKHQPNGSYTYFRFLLNSVSSGAMYPQGGLIYGPGNAVTGTGLGGGDSGQGAVFSIGPP